MSIVVCVHKTQQEGLYPGIISVYPDISRFAICPGDGADPGVRYTVLYRCPPSRAGLQLRYVFSSYFANPLVWSTFPGPVGWVRIVNSSALRGSVLGWQSNVIMAEDPGFADILLPLMLMRYRFARPHGWQGSGVANLPELPMRICRRKVKAAPADVHPIAGSSGDARTGMKEKLSFTNIMTL